MTPTERLKYHVSGAIAHGEAAPDWATRHSDPRTGAERLADVEAARELLRIARTYLVRAGAPRARAAVVRAAKSVDGARRHAMRGDIFAKRTP